MGNITYYRILGVQKGATTSEIKNRYRVLAKRYHPDNNGSTQLMTLINKAYKILSDPILRYRYDQQLTINSQSKDSNFINRKPSFNSVATIQRQRFSFWKLASAASLFILIIAIIGLSFGNHQNGNIIPTNTQRRSKSNNMIISPAVSPLSNQVTQHQTLSHQNIIQINKSHKNSKHNNANNYQPMLLQSYADNQISQQKEKLNSCSSNKSLIKPKNSIGSNYQKTDAGYTEC